MALQHDRVIELADSAATLSTDIVRLFARVRQYLDNNTAHAIDWGAGSKPAYINEEANNNLSGRLFQRQDVSNAIGTLLQLRNLMENQAVTQGNHLGNLNKLAKPL